MPKFFVKTDWIKEDKIQIGEKDVKHIKNVLRMKIGDSLVVCNEENGQNYLCQIDTMGDSVTCRIVEKLVSEAEPKLSLTIMQGLPKADKMEYIIQKAVELGVANIIPLKMEHCVVKLTLKDAQKKRDRWQSIAESAAKQCKRDKVPQIREVQTIFQIAEQLGQYDKVLIAYEKEKQVSLKEKIGQLKEYKKENLKIAIIIGPEGGIDEKEVGLLLENGAETISLGNRILRTETAPLAMSSILMYELGDLG